MCVKTLEFVKNVILIGQHKTGATNQCCHLSQATNKICFRLCVCVCVCVCVCAVVVAAAAAGAAAVHLVVVVGSSSLC